MSEAAAEEAPRINFHDLEPRLESFRDAVLQGLSKARKEVPCKFLYDAHGSRLFDEICHLEEYYPTRTEVAILEARGDEIGALIGPRAQLVEFGSGSSRKVRVLLEAMHAPASYMPIDISKRHLLDAAHSLAHDHPKLEIVPVCADYTQDFALPGGAGEGAAKRVGFFPGSTVGNFAPAQALAFLGSVATLLGPGGELLIGTDLKKDAAVLEAAYNDSRGVTAAFNLNLLVRINRELDGGFDLDRFAHHAFYNAVEGRVEMHLRSLAAQSVAVAGRVFSFAEGETIHTESSYKFEIEGFLEIAGAGGFVPVRTWTDSRKLFGLHYLKVA